MTLRSFRVLSHSLTACCLVPFCVSPHVLAESLAVVPAGEVKVSVEVEVVRRQLGHPQDGHLALLLDWSNVILPLRLPHERLLQTGDHLSLGMHVLTRRAGKRGKEGEEKERNYIKQTSMVLYEKSSLLF